MPPERGRVVVVHVGDVVPLLVVMPVVEGAIPRRERRAVLLAQQP